MHGYLHFKNHCLRTKYFYPNEGLNLSSTVEVSNTSTFSSASWVTRIGGSAGGIAVAGSTTLGTFAGTTVILSGWAGSIAARVVSSAGGTGRSTTRLAEGSVMGRIGLVGAA